MEFDELKQLADDLGTSAAMEIMEASATESERQLGMFVTAERVLHHLGLSLNVALQSTTNELAEELGNSAVAKVKAAVETKEERQLGMFLVAHRIMHHLGLSLSADVQIAHHIAGRWPDGSQSPFSEIT